MSWKYAAVLVVTATIGGHCVARDSQPVGSSPRGDGLGAGAEGAGILAGYSAPLVISRGGTYSGNWRSDAASVPTVLIQTREPVVIQNCRLRGRGDLVRAVLSGTNITIRNCVGEGENAAARGVANGRFVSAYMPESVSVENNELIQTAGIYIDGAGRAPVALKIRYNRARNIEGRWSDGANGYLLGFTPVQFVQLNNVRAAAGVEIAWNEVVNQARRSRVEDNINVYISSGTQREPMLVHDNFVWGAFPAEPSTDSYSGGGIIVDGTAPSREIASANIRIFDNQVIATTNYGIAIAAGLDVEVINNRVISSGRTDDGQRIAAANVGIYVWDINRDAQHGTFGGHRVANNTIAWISKTGQRNDQWFADCAGSECGSNINLRETADGSLERAELAIWKAKLKRAQVVVGPRDAR